MDDLSTCKTLHGLYPRDNDVKLVLRCLIWLRPHKPASRASVRITYAVLAQLVN